MSVRKGPIVLCAKLAPVTFDDSKILETLVGILKINHGFTIALLTGWCFYAGRYKAQGPT